MKDLFSAQAALYARYRPVYPPALFDHILQEVPRRESAWDCATGNGQTATILAAYFDQVMATDISADQMALSPVLPNVQYSVQPAEQTHFPDNSFDLVTVSQALHWFDFDRFYPELIRVTRPDGIFAAWMYGGIRISPEIDALKKKLHDELLGAYWDPARRYVNNEYDGIPFPLSEIPCPDFSMTYQWSPEELKGYFNTWSALQSFIQQQGYNPVDALMDEILVHWTGPRMPVRFPIRLRMGRIRK